MSLYIPFGFMQENATPTPTPTPTPTGTPTPTPTVTPVPFCTDTIVISNADPSLSNYNGTYTNITTYTGGTFTGGYLYRTTGVFGYFVTGNMTETGLLYKVYERYDSGFYYTLLMRNTSETATPFSWGIVKCSATSIVNGGTVSSSNGTYRVNNSNINGTNTGTIYIPLSGTTVTGATYPLNVYYYDVCPSPTPTPTGTPTPTPTNTPTPTPTNTPLFSGSGYYALTSDGACSGPISGISGNFTGNTNTFCDSIYFTGNTFASQSTGTYYLAYSGNIQQILITFGSNVVLVSGGGCSACPSPTPTATPTPTGTPTPTPTPTGTPEPPPAYNYYTFTPCVGGAGTDYRSILSLALNDIYAFQASPPARNCYEITSITASVNSNDLPTIYGPKTDCSDSDCTQP